MTDFPSCIVVDCQEPGSWYVLPVTEDTPPHGFTHSGRLFAPYRISHIRQAEYCLGHARMIADAKNRQVKMMDSRQAIMRVPR